jgi:hypothetical protein
MQEDFIRLKKKQIEGNELVEMAIKGDLSTLEAMIFGGMNTNEVFRNAVLGAATYYMNQEIDKMARLN